MTQNMTQNNFDTQHQIQYQESINNPQKFWAEQAKILDWIKFPEKIISEAVSQNLNQDSIQNIHWFEDGILNASVNCLDRHLEKNAEKIALIFEGDDPKNSQKISFKNLYQQVCQLANFLKSRGLKKGDRVCIYLPMIPEAVISMLACARLGLVHSVIFGGFSPSSIRDRVLDCEATCIITADYGFRGGKTIGFKSNIDEALNNLPISANNPKNPEVSTVLVIKNKNLENLENLESLKNSWVTNRDFDYKNLIPQQAISCPPEPMKSEDPLFILYTSGSTGKPKGVVHSTGGYLLFAALSHKVIFDLNPQDIYWSTADVGWITGHSYVTYGPLANGTTTVIFEGIPTYPSYSRFWEIIDKHQVSIFYTAPTALRALMKAGDEPLKNTKRSSLRILGSVGEPINPECWLWFFNQVGNKQCPIMDTWWQTETGGFMLAPPREINKQKPGCAQRPFLGILPVLLDSQGKIIEGEGEGALCIKHPWPGMLKTIYNNPERLISAYFKTYPGYYFSGDSARRDQDGDIWIGGRMDDVINVSGHRLSTAEIESALVLHPTVAEAAVVGFPHEIKGEGIYAYVTLMDGESPSDDLIKTLITHVRKTIGPVVTIDLIQWAPQLPKTRSGKIMRRILRKIAAGELDQLGDLSTLANPEAVEDLKNQRKKLGTCS